MQIYKKLHNEISRMLRTRSIDYAMVDCLKMNADQLVMNFEIWISDDGWEVRVESVEASTLKLDSSLNSRTARKRSRLDRAARL
ncbi:hypothetical protein PRIPAC_78514 [Pristionchus pacificus]|uniref:Uncharacterized protein n=1 Tax=Pristionchus pacificus TaxID=54126 RepID=A0A2A6BVZ1_PRIPA|nr:hypothetical protein PRIPAC_78514 [Pristionchus pacificus]|eukprot:PDM70038.1 hypothetical protein PRIPAC_49250 [Pristionchus pacificus]